MTRHGGRPGENARDVTADQQTDEGSDSLWGNVHRTGAPSFPPNPADVRRPTWRSPDRMSTPRKHAEQRTPRATPIRYPATIRSASFTGRPEYA